MAFSMSWESSLQYIVFFCHIFIIEIQILWSNSKFSLYHEPNLQDAGQQTKAKYFQKLFTKHSHYTLVILSHLSFSKMLSWSHKIKSFLAAHFNKIWLQLLQANNQFAYVSNNKQFVNPKGISTVFCQFLVCMLSIIF